MFDCFECIFAIPELIPFYGAPRLDLEYDDSNGDNLLWAMWTQGRYDVMDDL